MSAGHVKVGASSSDTVTVKLHVVVLPAGSDTVYVTVVTPKLNVPDAFVPVPDPLVTPLYAHVVEAIEQLSSCVKIKPVTSAVQL